MFCTNCGYQFTRDVQFCPQCGEPVESISESTSQSENGSNALRQTGEKIEQPTPFSFDYKIKYGIGVAICMLFIVLIEFTGIRYLNYRTLLLMAVYAFCIILTYHFPSKKAVLYPAACILISLCYCYYYVQILGNPCV